MTEKSFKSKLAMDTIMISSRLATADTIEEKVNINSALSIMAIASSLPASDGKRLLNIARNISRRSEGREL